MAGSDPFLLFLGITATVLVAWPRIFLFYRSWIALPIAEHRSRRYPLTPEWEETTADQLTPELREFLGRAVVGFREAGFEVLANVRRKDESEGGKLKTSQWVVPMVHPVTGDLGSIAMVTNRYVRLLSFQVASEFSDGFRMVTRRSRDPGVLPTNPETHSVTFPWVSDPAVLVEAHRRRVAQAGRAEHARRPIAPGTLIQEMNQSWEREIDWFVRIGYQYRDQTRNSVRLTWRGAFLLQWRVKPVIKAWLLRRGDAKARRIWNGLGMDQWTPPVRLVRADDSPPPTTSRSGNDPSPPDDASASLAYQSELAPGHIRRQKSDGTLTIRVMLPTASLILARIVPEIILAIILIALIAACINRTWLIRQAPLSVILHREPSFIQVDLLIFVGLLIYESAQIWKAFSRRARGTTLLSASHEGLRLSNGPGPIRNGHFPRPRIEALLVTYDQFGLGCVVFQLQARLTGEPRRVILLVSRDNKRLGMLRQELLEAMGIMVQPDQ